MDLDLDGNRVPSDKVVVEFGVTYSVVDTREADGIICVEVRAEGAAGNSGHFGPVVYRTAAGGR